MLLVLRRWNTCEAFGCSKLVCEFEAADDATVFLETPGKKGTRRAKSSSILELAGRARGFVLFGTFLFCAQVESGVQSGEWSLIFLWCCGGEKTAIWVWFLLPYPPRLGTITNLFLVVWRRPEDHDLGAISSSALLQSSRMVFHSLRFRTRRLFSWAIECLQMVLGGDDRFWAYQKCALPA